MIPFYRVLPAGLSLGSRNCRSNMLLLSKSGAASADKYLQPLAALSNQNRQLQIKQGKRATNVLENGYFIQYLPLLTNIVVRLPHGESLWVKMSLLKRPREWRKSIGR